MEFRKIAIATPGFSGADLANTLNEAALQADCSPHTAEIIDQQVRVLLDAAMFHQLLKEGQESVPLN